VDAEKSFFPACQAKDVAEKFAEALPSVEVHEKIMVVARNLQSGMQQLHEKQRSEDGNDACSFLPFGHQDLPSPNGKIHLS